MAIPLPWIWPPLLLSAFLAWTQASMWMPYGLPGVRVIVAALCLVAVDAIVIIAFHYRVREAVMIAILAPQIPVAYLIAWFAVTRARRGVVPRGGSAPWAWVGSVTRRWGAGSPAPPRATSTAMPRMSSLATR